MTTPDPKTYSLWLVRRFAKATKRNDECLRDAIVHATQHANYAEIAAAAGWSRQGISKFMKRTNNGNEVDKETEKV